MESKLILKLLASDKYDFLKSHDMLKNNIMYLTMGGSIAYGTNLPGQGDIDVRGVFYNSKKEILTMNCREKPFEHKETDTVIYPFKQLIKLLINCNPNVLELFGTKDEHVFSIDNNGRLIRDNIHLFLSHKAKHTFGGYAVSQLRRLQNSLIHDKYPQLEKEKHILATLETQMNHFQRIYSSFDNNHINLSIDDTEREGFDKEIYMDINLKHYPLRDFKAIYSDMYNIIKDYDKLNHRNNKKDDLHLNKHAMHLIRLYLMCIDIFEQEKVITYREKDKDLLLEIRRGAYQTESGNYRDEFFQMVNEYEKRLNYAIENSSLPNEPREKEILDLISAINYSIIKR